MNSATITETAKFFLRYPSQLVRRLEILLFHDSATRMEVEDFLPLLPDNPVIIEAGASRGMDTLKFANLWPAGKIFAFEPEPATFALLSDVVKGFENIIIEEVALAADSGTAVLNISSSKDETATDASSLLKPTGVKDVWSTLEFKKSVTVRTVSLSDLMEMHGLPKVDLMWLDMQGAELEFLKGSPEMLQRVKYVYMEVSLREMYEGMPLYPEVKRTMQKFGFKPKKEFLTRIQGDVLFKQTAIAPND